MRLHRAFGVLAVVVATNAAYGQHPNRGGHAAGGHPAGGGHMGGVPNHMVHPAMQQHHMLQQQFNGMMFEMEMMAREQEARLAARRRAGMARPQSLGAGGGGGTGHRSQNHSTASLGMSRQHATGGQPSQQRSAGSQQASPGKAPTSQSGAQHGKANGKAQPNQAHAQANQQSKKHPSSDSKEAKKKEKEKSKEAEKLHHARADARKHQTSGTASDGAMLEQLKLANGRLQSADHDYAGHRVRAMEHIHGAAAQLGSSLGFGMLGLGTGAGHMSQQQSDERLREALRHLRTVEGSLGTGGNRRAHHDRARGLVAQAIREVEMALRIR